MYRPDDIPLPEGWSWPLVEAQRAKWDIAANMVPVASAGGAVAWGTIDSVRFPLGKNQNSGVIGMKNHTALYQIQALLSGREWTADTLESIAEIMRLAGFTIDAVGERCVDLDVEAGEDRSQITGRTKAGNDISGI